MRLSVYLGENEIRTVLGRSGKKDRDYGLP